MINMTEQERERFLAKLRPFLNRGDYKSALGITKQMLRKYPNALTAQYQHAKILGDWADELPAARQKKLKAEAVRMLKPLRRRLRGRPMEERFGLCLNYYYQSQDWRGMYAFGRRFARTNRAKSLYATGLGATLLAYDLRKTSARSRSWAKRAIKAWSRYDFKNEDYYFPHYCFAKALALNGQSEESLKRLKTAAKLGKRKISDWEFADVLDLLPAK